MTTDIRHLKLALAALATVAAVAVACWLWHGLAHSTVSVEVNDRIHISPEQIERIRAIGQWEFLSVADEQLVDTTRRGLFNDDHLVRIYYGTLRLGIDLSHINDGWLTTAGDTLTARLPAVTLLDDAFIDEARTKSFYETGRWQAAAREALYQKARRQMLAHALTPANIEQARRNGEAQFRQVMQAMGWKEVVIVWGEPSHR